MIEPDNEWQCCAVPLGCLRSRLRTGVRVLLTAQLQLLDRMSLSQPLPADSDREANAGEREHEAEQPEMFSSCMDRRRNKLVIKANKQQADPDGF